MKNKVIVKCINHYYDAELNKDIYPTSEHYIVSSERANILKQHNVVEIVKEVDEVEIPKPTSTIRVKKYTKRSDK